MIFNLESNEANVSQIALVTLESLKVSNSHILFLSGELGAGKTTFMKELAKILGVQEEITSPTFVIQKQYDIEYAPWKKLVHIDAYRLEGDEEYIEQEIGVLKLRETLENKENLVCVEWGERFHGILKGELTLSIETINEELRRYSLK